MSVTTATPTVRPRTRPEQSKPTPAAKAKPAAPPAKAKDSFAPAGDAARARDSRQLAQQQRVSAPVAKAKTDARTAAELGRVYTDERATTKQREAAVDELGRRVAQGDLQAGIALKEGLREIKDPAVYRRAVDQIARFDEAIKSDRGNTHFATQARKSMIGDAAQAPTQRMDEMRKNVPERIRGTGTRSKELPPETSREELKERLDQRLAGIKARGGASVGDMRVISQVLRHPNATTDMVRAAHEATQGQKIWAPEGKYAQDVATFRKQMKAVVDAEDTALKVLDKIGPNALDDYQVGRTYPSASPGINARIGNQLKGRNKQDEADRSASELASKDAAIRARAKAALAKDPASLSDDGLESIVRDGSYPTGIEAVDKRVDGWLVRNGEMKSVVDGAVRGLYHEKDPVKRKQMQAIVDRNVEHLSGQHVRWMTDYGSKVQLTKPQLKRVLHGSKSVDARIAVAQKMLRGGGEMHENSRNMSVKYWDNPDIDRKDREAIAALKSAHPKQLRDGHPGFGTFWPQGTSKQTHGDRVNYASGKPVTYDDSTKGLFRDHITAAKPKRDETQAAARERVYKDTLDRIRGEDPKKANEIHQQFKTENAGFVKVLQDPKASDEDKQRAARRILGAPPSTTDKSMRDAALKFASTRGDVLTRSMGLSSTKGAPLSEETLARIPKMISDRFNKTLQSSRSPAFKRYRDLSQALHLVRNPPPGKRANPNAERQIKAEMRKLWDGPIKREADRITAEVKRELGIPRLIGEQTKYLTSPAFEKRLQMAGPNMRKEMVKRELTKLKALDPRGFERIKNHVSATYLKVESQDGLARLKERTPAQQQNIVNSALDAIRPGLSDKLQPSVKTSQLFSKFMADAIDKGVPVHELPEYLRKQTKLIESADLKRDFGRFLDGLHRNGVFGSVVGAVGLINVAGDLGQGKFDLGTGSALASTLSNIGDVSKLLHGISRGKPGMFAKLGGVLDGFSKIPGSRYIGPVGDLLSSYQEAFRFSEDIKNGDHAAAAFSGLSTASYHGAWVAGLITVATVGGPVGWGIALGLGIVGGVSSWAADKFRRKPWERFRDSFQSKEGIRLFQ